MTAAAEPIDLGLLILRVVAGLVITAHGAQKLFGWWDGPGLHGWRRTIQSMGIRPVQFWAVASLSADLFGGVLLVLGLFTPFAAAALTGPMVVAILQKWPKGLWSVKGGYEYPLLVLTVAVALAMTGPGAVSIDAAIAFELETQVRWMIVLLAATGGAVAVLTRKPPVEQPSR